MMRDVPVFQVSPGSRLEASIGPKWALVPLCIPGGWAVHWNTIEARKLSSGEIESNDSEDLFWAIKLPPPDTHVYVKDPTSHWREIHVDAGWYRDRFRIVMLDPDWDHVRRSYSTKSFEEFVARLEAWLIEIVVDGDVKIFDPAKD